MIRNLMARRAREEARVDAFLHAILLTEQGYTLDPTWQLQHVEDDTQALPVQLVQLLVPVQA